MYKIWNLWICVTCAMNKFYMGVYTLKWYLVAITIFPVKYPSLFLGWNILTIFPRNVGGHWTETRRSEEWISWVPKLCYTIELYPIHGRTIQSYWMPTKIWQVKYLEMSTLLSYVQQKLLFLLSDPTFTMLHLIRFGSKCLFLTFNILLESKIIILLCTYLIFIDHLFIC